MRFLGAVPLWGIFVITVVVVLGAIEVGARLGRRRRESPEHETEGAVGAVAGASLGLLAFLLAFTFGIAADRFQTRKELLLQEVNVIGTTFLRAGLVPDPTRTEIRELLREYVDGRIAVVREPQNLPELLERASAIHRELWSHVASLAGGKLDSDIGALLVESTNHLIEMHATRATVALQYRIPGAVWATLGVVGVLAMAIVGYHFGLSGPRGRSLDLALAVTFAAVIWLIVDLDRWAEGVLRVNQQPMIELRERLR